MALELDSSGRRLVRMAYRVTDPELRRRILEDLRAARQPSLSPLARKLVRVAFATTDETLRRGILDSIRTAAYAPEFLEWARARKHRKSTTGNRVKWDSLTSQEKAQVHAQWQQQAQGQPAEGKPAQPQAPFTGVSGEVYEKLSEFYPRRPKDMDELREMHEKGEAWHLPAVAMTAGGGMKFWEARGEDGKISIRWGPVGGWQQSKPGKSLEDAMKRFQAKAHKGYMVAGPGLAMSFSGGPVGMSGDTLWKRLEKDYGDDPAKMRKVVEAAVSHLENLDSTDPGQWPDLASTAKELRERLKEQAKEPEKPEKPKKPEKKKVQPKQTDPLTKTQREEVDELVMTMSGEVTAVGDLVKYVDKIDAILPEGLTTAQRRGIFEGVAKDLADHLDTAAFTVDDPGDSQLYHDTAYTIRQHAKEWAKQQSEKKPVKKEPEKEPEKPKEKLEIGTEVTSTDQMVPGMFISNSAGIVGKITSILPDGGVRFRTFDTGAGEYRKGTKTMSKEDAEAWFAKGNSFTVTEDPAPKKPKKPEKKEPGAPKPTGKYKDRKELRGKGKKKPTDKVEAKTALGGKLIPPGLKGPQRDAAEKQLEGLTYEGLSKIRGHLAAALASPDSPYAKGLAKAGYDTSEKALKGLQALIDERLEDVKGRRYHSDVLGVANKHDMEGEDADALHEFKASKPKRGKKLTDQELMQRFLSKASPETRERMQDMPVADFMVAYKAIMADEEEEEAA